MRNVTHSNQLFGLRKLEMEYPLGINALLVAAVGCSVSGNWGVLASMPR